MIVEEIAAGIAAVAKLLADLNAAKARAVAGAEMTSADRAALDAANGLKADRVNALIDARIGPDLTNNVSAPAGGNPMASPAPPP